MEQNEGQSSMNGGEGHFAGQRAPGVGENLDRLVEILNTYADRQTTAITGSTTLLEKFKRLYPTEFEGTVDPSAADA